MVYTCVNDLLKHPAEHHYGAESRRTLNDPFLLMPLIHLSSYTERGARKAYIVLHMNIEAYLQHVYQRLGPLLL